MITKTKFWYLNQLFFNKKLNHKIFWEYFAGCEKKIQKLPVNKTSNPMANQIREFCYSYDKKISVITIIILKSVLKGDVKQILAIWPPHWVKQK